MLSDLIKDLQEFNVKLQAKLFLARLKWFNLMSYKPIVTLKHKNVIFEMSTHLQVVRYIISLYL